MIEMSPQHQLESIISLQMALSGNFEKDLTEQESERNISQNIVGVHAIDKIISKLPSSFSFAGYSGSGLMITTSGFVVTAYHNIQHLEKEWKRIQEEDPVTQQNVNLWLNRMVDRYCVIDQQNNIYPIDTSFWITNPNMDIALIKVVTNKHPEPIQFKMVDSDLNVGDEVKLFGLKNHTLYNQYGQVVSKSYDAQMYANGEIQSTTYDTFLTDAYGVPGFSGGVFTDLHGAFAGLSLYTQKEDTREIGKAGGAKVKHIVELVEHAAYLLGKIQLGLKR